MTIHNMRLIDLDDILSIQLECASKECRVKVSLGPESWDKMPNRCPACGSLWWEDRTHEASDSAENAIKGLHHSLERVAYLQEQRRAETKIPPAHLLGCNISLETKIE